MDKDLVRTSAMKTIKVSIQDIYNAMKPNVYRNRKKYYRKSKHKNQSQ